MTPSLPYIPETAPFSPTQRAWLNGLFAGIWTTALPQPEASNIATSRNVAVLYASQTGTGERLAKKIAKELKLKGHTARVASLEGYAPMTLATEEYAVILASTYGEGEPPDSAKAFFDQLCHASAPKLNKLTFSILALGDRNYEHFCKFGFDLDERLASLGAIRLNAPVPCDVDVDVPFEMWKSELLQRLIKSEASQILVVDTSSRAVLLSCRYDREHPFKAQLKEKRALTHNISSKLTLHMAFSLANSDLTYEAGDALGVVPANDPELVAEILARTNISDCEMVELPKLGTRSIVEALRGNLQIARLSRKLVEAFAQLGDVHTLKGLLKPEQQTHFDEYIYDRGLIDLLDEYPGVISSAQQLANLLPKLAPRLYSISSSLKAHVGEVHATVAVVRYRSHNRQRGGVCSTMFADRSEVGSSLPVYIQRNKKFKLPSDDDAPVIMIGPGTGIAPFRGFLHERCVTGARGRNWLFFGERSASTDFLYREELEQMSASGLLTRLDTAFSRDQAHKIYVQDRMLENGAELYEWLEQGASLYVCGDASRMAKDVDLALHKLIEKYGAHNEESAKEYVQTMHDDKRYHLDVY